MSTLEKVTQRITDLEDANKGSTISTTVWNSFRKFVTAKSVLVSSIEKHFAYFYFNDDRLLHFVYAMALVFTGDAQENTVNQRADNAKAMKATDIAADVISRLILIDKGHQDQACEFTVTARCGLTKATAKPNVLPASVVDELVNRASKCKVGVLIIHMYVDPPALNNVFLGEGSAISKMVTVIEVARKCNVPIFLVWKHEKEVLGPKRLREAVSGYNLVEEYVCTHNSFLNNRDYAKAILEKGLDDMIVMGYDADVCVRGTVFGSEYANPIPHKDIEQEWNLFKMQHPDRQGKDKEAIFSFLEKNKAKFTLNEKDYAPSLLELVGRVVTSRSLLVNDGGGIGSVEWGPLLGTRGIKVG